MAVATPARPRGGVLVGLLAVLLAADELTPPSVRFGPLMVAAPALAAVLCGPGYVLAVLGVTLGCVVAAAQANLQLDVINFPVQLATTAVIGAAAVWAATLRQHRERQLAQVRWVAEVAQRLLLRPIPRRLGPLTVASVYLAADEEAEIGGDVYAATDLGGAARFLIGDAQGKGLAAVEMVTHLLGAFRQSRRERVALEDLACRLEDDLCEAVAETAAAKHHGDGPDPEGHRDGDTWPRGQEGFVTAVVMDVPVDGGPVRLVNRGHPAPLLLRDGQVSPLDPAAAALPLGLGDLDADGAPVRSADFRAGDTLLLYTDGLIEARDGAGAFYPLTARLGRWPRRDPDELLRELRADLLAHARGRLTDDVAVIAIHRAD